MIAETAIMGNLGDRMIGPQERDTGLMDTKSVDKSHGRHAKITAKDPLELTHGQIGHMGQILHINPGFVVCTDIIDDAAHFVVGFPRIPQPVQILGDSGQANNSLIF